MVEKHATDYIAKKNRKDTSDKMEETEICSWCADEYHQGDDLLMCDTCPRGFCDKCVSLAHGSGAKGDSVVKELMAVDSLWSCIHCKPTILLKAMRDKWTKGVTEEDEDGSSSQSDDESESLVMESEDNDEKIQRILEQLTSLEDLIESIGTMLETDGIEKQRNVFERLSKAESNLSLSPDEVEAKLDEWVRSKKDQYARCSDDIGLLQDELGKCYKSNPIVCYTCSKNISFSLSGLYRRQKSEKYVIKYITFESTKKLFCRIKFRHIKRGFNLL